MEAPNNTPQDFAAVQQAITQRRYLLGETVWQHVGTERRAWIAIEECAKHRTNFYLFTKWNAQHTNA